MSRKAFARDPAVTIRNPRIGRNPRKSGGATLSSELEFDDAALEPDHGGVGAVVGAQLREDIPHATLDGFFSDRQQIGNLLVRVPSGNQPQDVNSAFVMASSVACSASS